MFSCRFRWAHAGTGEALPNQERLIAAGAAGESLLGIIIAAGPLFLQPHFLLPYGWPSGELRAHLRAMEETLPFAFRDAWFQHVFATKKPGQFRYRRVAGPR